MGVTLEGRKEIIDLSRNGGGGNRVSALNIGEGTTDFDPSDTSLEDPLDFEGGLTTTRDNDKLVIQAEFTDNDGTVEEAGIVSQADTTATSFDSENDTQVVRQQVPAINVLAEDKIDLTFELQALNDGTN